MLAEDALTEGQRVGVAAILRGCRSAQTYVDRLREMTCGAWERPQRRKVALADFMERCREAGEGICRPKHIRLSVTMDVADAPAEGAGDIPAMSRVIGGNGDRSAPGANRSAVIDVDEAELLRAVTNLLDNAARFTPSGGRVALAARLAAGRLTLTVRDGGAGFSPEALARAGSALSTSESERPRDGHMGMGLYFVRRVAEAHGGEMRLSNAPEGAVVTISIPAGRAEE